MAQNILKIFIENGFLLDREMLDFLNELEDENIAKEIIEKIALVSKKKMITKNLISENFDKLKPVLFELGDEKKKLVEKFFVNVSISVEIKKETHVEDKKSEESRSSIKILSSPILTSQKLEVKDFIKHFRNRYVFLRNILQQRTELENLTSIDKIKNNSNRNFSIIGIVTEKRITKNKNIILSVEDLTDSIKLLINQNKNDIFVKAKEILVDDVIGFRCSGTKDFLYVNDLFYPDLFVSEKHRSENEDYALFISDIHVGSVNFLQRNFEKFLDWIVCKDSEEQKDLIKKIRYIFITGDNVDGVGIYPGQEKFLNIKDIKEQYQALANYLKKIPSHVNIVMCPGQHDGVRVAEPQPPIGLDFGEALYEIPNLYLVSNPSVIEIETGNGKPGIKILMYHGDSIHPVISEIEELRLTNARRNPTRAVKHLLLRRHLSPMHGMSIYIPNAEEDPMIIREIPDIVATGDLHRTDIDKYNGILLIAGSCWQSITPFEEKVGNMPDPCKIPMLNLKTGAIKILDFSEVDEEDRIKEVECKEIKNEEKKDDGKEIICEVKAENG